MRLPPLSERAVALVKREGTSNKTLIIVAVVVLGILIVSIFIHLLYKSSISRKRGSTSNGRQLWRAQSRGAYSSQLQGDELSTTSGGHRSGDVEREMENGTNRNSTADGVNRNTSIRSIMTLPAYSPAVRENERILAREGERGGIDTVVEFPETQDEEEARREEEMESLYQIRVARRVEQAEREERRRQRREARARGDYDALAEIRQRTEAAAQESVSGTLIAEHQTADRSRRVSSVQYGDLGVARADGSRLRANSSESERPLLDSAASIGGTSIRAGSIGNLSTHQRGRSGSSVLSISTTGSDDYLPSQRHRTVSGGTTDFEVVSLNNPHSRSPSISRSIINERDMGDQPIPQIDPPMYDDLTIEDAPPYSSPVQTRAPTLPLNGSSQRSGPQLPIIERLPSIRITGAISPIDGRLPELPSTQTTEQRN